MKKDIKPLTREATIAMLNAIRDGGFDEANKAILNGFLNPDGAITVEVIESPLQVDSLTESEFEEVVQKIRRARYGGQL